MFVNQGAAFAGTMGRNVITGPGYSNLDIALTKNLRESMSGSRLQFRADAFDSSQPDQLLQSGYDCWILNAWFGYSRYAIRGG